MGLEQRHDAALQFLELFESLSLQKTSCPICARQAAVVSPTYPAPITEIFIFCLFPF